MNVLTGGAVVVLKTPCYSLLDSSLSSSMPSSFRSTQEETWAIYLIYTIYPWRWIKTVVPPQFIRQQYRSPFLDWIHHGLYPSWKDFRRR